MDGIHDLGGKQGYGPIDVNEVEEAFHADWEGRMWAIARLCSAPDWTIDWWRNVREHIDPIDYLSRPYFDSWMQTYAVAFICSGTFTAEEVIAGSTTLKGAEARALSYDDAIQFQRASCRDFTMACETEAKYSVGDEIRTVEFIDAAHTRLPQYARNKPGVIRAYTGSHPLPDDSARGIEHGEHLYSVCFAARDLWGPTTNENDEVIIDLWESYLEQR
ncbi:MAG: nitrile hydratase subunit beta [Pseudoruegeria sp.]